MIFTYLIALLTLPTRSLGGCRGIILIHQELLLEVGLTLVLHIGAGGDGVVLGQKRPNLRQSRDRRSVLGVGAKQNIEDPPAPGLEDDIRTLGISGLPDLVSTRFQDGEEW